MVTKNFNEYAKFQPKQIEAFNTLLSEECKYLLYGGAAAGGKSYFLRWSAIALSIWYYQKYKIKHVPIGLFCEDYPTLKDRQISRIKREIPARFGQLKESRDEGYAFQVADDLGGGLILLRNLDDPSKYFSTEFAGIFVDELTRNDRQTFEDLRFRLRYPGIKDTKFVSATNPGGIGHGWVKQFWIDQNVEDPEKERFKYIPALYSDNKYVDESYVKQLESLPEDKRRAYMDGDWNVFAGQYFSEWRVSQHVINPFMPSKLNVIVGGMDWGRAKPFSFHLAEVSRINMEGTIFFRVKVFLEVYGTERTPREWWTEKIKKALEFYTLKPVDITWVQGDPAMWTKGQDNSISIKDQFVDAYDEFGRKLRPASNDRIGGWENYHNWLSLAPDGMPYYQVTTQCPNLIRTLPELIHDDIKVEDVDSSGEDHAPDDQRYMLKKLKWIDAKLGAVIQIQPGQQLRHTAQFIDNKQLSVNLDAFGDPHDDNSSVGGIHRG